MRRDTSVGEIEARLRELHAAFEAERNPLYALEAVAIVLETRTTLPDWSREFLLVAIRFILEAATLVERSSRIAGEAEIVGKAFGFGHGRPGRGWFRQAAIRKRDRDICSRIQAELERDPNAKLDALYYEIAHKVGVHMSTVGRAWRARKRESGPEP